MKKLNRILTTALAVVFAAGCMVLYSGVLTDVSAAGDYKYTVKVYSGSEGYFDGDTSKHVKVISGEGFKSGEEYSIDVDDIGLTLVHPKKYYARGIKIAGHDNDDRIFRSGTFWATRDESYSVAYGMKGGMVMYKVRYVDKSDNDLRDPEEYYGMVGDKPVVSYAYVEGYLPQAYNLGKTLTSNESDNVFKFVYEKAGDADTSDDEEDEGDGGEAADVDDDDDSDDNDSDSNATANNTTNNGNTQGGYIPGFYGDTDANDDGQPAEYVDLDDDETPLAEDADSDEGKADENKEGWFASLPTIGKIGLILAIVLAIVAAIIALVRRNMYEYVYEDDEEEEDKDNKDQDGNDQ